LRNGHAVDPQGPVAVRAFGPASGITFLSLEDETGFCNVVVRVGVWAAFRAVARDSAALIVRGKVERANGVTNLVADHFERLPLAARTTSRDFR
jgi:error-prone DNA polymerase